MATRTFLELVNDVLLELREPAVATWDETDYSTLIGRFINTAKLAVEQAWYWTALREGFTITTVVGDVQYTITGARSRFQILQPDDFYNKTAKGRVRQLNRSAHRALFNGDFTDTTGVEVGPVHGYSFVETLDNGSKQVNVYPVPNAVESLRVFGYNPPDDFDADGDILYIPARPIVDTAVALARGERGEDGGITVNEATAFARTVTADAIAIDANQNDEDISWEAV